MKLRLMEEIRLATWDVSNPCKQWDIYIYLPHQLVSRILSINRRSNLSANHQDRSWMGSRAPREGRGNSWEVDGGIRRQTQQRTFPGRF